MKRRNFLIRITSFVTAGLIFPAVAKPILVRSSLGSIAPALEPGYFYAPYIPTIRNLFINGVLVENPAWIGHSIEDFTTKTPIDLEQNK